MQITICGHGLILLPHTDGHLYHDMSENLDLFDTSNFEKDHHLLYTTKNNHVHGKFKSKTGSLTLHEFVGLRTKMYSLDVPHNSKIRAKGIKKSHIKKHASHQQFVNILNSLKPTSSTF